MGAREFTSRKEAAVFAGATGVVMGKGRMSREANAVLDKAIKDGRVVIVTAPAKAPKRERVKDTAPVVATAPKVAKVKSSDVLDPAPMVWPAGTRVFNIESGEEGSMKNCCFHCRVSLNWCQCHLINRVPRAIVGDTSYVPVRLEAPA